MTKEYFNSLDIDQRAEIAFQKAKYIGTLSKYVGKKANENEFKKLEL